MSYEANFVSHHTCDRHVGFLLAQHGIGKYNKMSHFIKFIPQYQILTVTRILAHTHVVEILNRSVK